jgi:hypothetical protein
LLVIRGPDGLRFYLSFQLVSSALAAEGMHSGGALAIDAVLVSPRTAEIVAWVVGETEQKRAFGAGDVDVGVVGILVGEGEVAAIWRPEGIDVVQVVVGWLGEAAAVMRDRGCIAATGSWWCAL